MIHSVRIPGVPKAACCSACAGGSGKLGDTTFSDFLDASPDAASQLSAYQTANPGDAVLQSVVYNPLTNTMGPSSLPAQSMGDFPGVAASSTPALLIIGGLVAAAFVIGSKKR